MKRERNIEEFNRDVSAHQGYVYARADRLSCRISNARMSEAIAELADLHGKTVVDVGCGDGSYTYELLQMGASSVVGIDAAEGAIRLARERYAHVPAMTFETCDIYSLVAPPARYQVAVLRGVLHHLYQVEKAIENVCRLADTIIVVEPNGNNPILKIIEQTSRYHIAHEEKSFPPRYLDQLFKRQGGEVMQSKYIGLVPMFCPDWMAKALKQVEPFVESLALIRALCCGQYVQKIQLRNR